MKKVTVRLDGLHDAARSSGAHLLMIDGKAAKPAPPEVELGSLEVVQSRPAQWIANHEVDGGYVVIVIFGFVALMGVWFRLKRILADWRAVRERQ